MNRPSPFPFLFLLAISAGAGCIDDGTEDGFAPMCESSSDCNQGAGEVCDIGVCWGDPPDTSAFAAILMPPADRSDLAPTELQNIAITPDGSISGLEFTETVTLHGRVVLGCDEGQTVGCGNDALVSAQINVERASEFLGGPRYRRSFSTNVTVGPDEDAFSITLPKDDAEYRITIVPDESAVGSLAAGEASLNPPPYSTTFRSSADLDITYELGNPSQLKSIQGCITSATGNGESFANMRVTALGRWTPLSKLERASAVAVTGPDGCFTLSVPIDMLDDFDILVKPGPGVTLPTLRLFDEYVRDPDPNTPAEVHVIDPLVMPNAANPVTFKLPVRGLAGSGSLDPVSGATVIFQTSFAPQPTEPRHIEVTFSAQAVSNSSGEDEPGMAIVNLYPGTFEVNRLYDIRVLPPPESEFASEFGATIAVGTGEGAPVLNALELNRRIAVSGRFLAADGSPLVDTPLTVRPTPVLRRDLMAPEDQTILDNLQVSTEVTDKNGEVLMWLDPELVGVAASYDFELAPPDFSSAPRWTFEEIDIESRREGDTLDLGDLVLPRASYARGEVRDPSGALVPGAEIRWFALPTSGACAAPATAECDLPARNVGIWEADESGAVVSVLPDP